MKSHCVSAPTDTMIVGSLYLSRTVICTESDSKRFDYEDVIYGGTIFVLLEGPNMAKNQQWDDGYRDYLVLTTDGRIHKIWLPDDFITSQITEVVRKD